MIRSLALKLFLYAIARVVGPFARAALRDGGEA